MTIRVVKTCVYCGSVATTKDHVPPQGLFPNIKGLQLKTVPCCEKCNQEFSKDEPFFRDHMVAFAMDKSITANTLFETKIRRSISYDKKLAEYMFNKMQEVDLLSPSNIFLGQRTAIKMPEEDWKRIHCILDKIVKGLLYIESGKTLPDSHVLRHFVISGKELLAKHQDLLPLIRWKLGKYDNVFLYGFANVPGLFDSVWLTQFYGTNAFMTFVRHKKYLETDKSSI